MIKNERQLAIARARLERLERTRTDVSGAPGAEDALRQLQLAAVDAELRALLADIQEYEALQRGETELPVATSLEELPTLLVRGRIAARLTQRDLASRLGVKEQQIQRYEATDYAGASLSRLIAVADALGLDVSPSLREPAEPPLDPKVLVRRLERVGLKREFVERRFLDPAAGSPRAALAGIARLSRVYGWSADDLLGGDARLRGGHAAASAYKKPRNSTSAAVDSLSVYAHYISRCVATAAVDARQRALPPDRFSWHRSLSGSAEVPSFESALLAVWDYGIPVVPLAEPGGFHAGYWNHNGTIVIVLNGAGREPSRWLFDLCHEIGHIVDAVPAPGTQSVEPDPVTAAISGDLGEQRANEFAAYVIFGGRDEDLYRQVVDAAAGRIGMYQRCVRMVARQHGVSVGPLAFAVAYRLQQRQGINWWAAARKLHEVERRNDADPWLTARDLLVERLDWAALPPLDADLVARCLDLFTATTAGEEGSGDDDA